MGFLKFDSGFCFDAASAPDERRLSGPSVDSPPADWTSPGVSNTPWTSSDEGPPVDEWKDGNGYGGGASTGTKISGTGDTITQDLPVAGTATLDDAAGAFVVGMVGTYITISGATAPGNNGLFKITAVNSVTQLEYKNADAVSVTESFSYGISQADQGYGSAAEPTKSWRFDVDHPDGWYTRVTKSRKASGEQ